MIEKFKNLVTISKYLIRINIARASFGLTFRSKVYFSIFLQFCRRPMTVNIIGVLVGIIGVLVGIIGIFFAIIGFAIPEQILMSYLKKAFSCVSTLRNSFPDPFRSTTFYLVLSIIVLVSLRSIISKERLFKITTRRLNDKIPEKKRAIKDNLEACLLIKQLKAGSENPKAYEFVLNLWKQHIDQTAGLSMLTVPGLPNPLPIVCVDIEHLSQNSRFGKDLLNSLLKVNMESRFPDFSKKEPSSRQVSTHKRLEDLYIRKPQPRYLRRFRGPTPKQTTFKDDYVGHNVCLRSMSFDGGKLAPPIDCTLELYGNIMDSCDILIEELNLHFALEKSATAVSPELTLNFLPWRKTLHHRYKYNPIDILTRVYGRAAGLGVSALTVFNMDGEFVAERGLRSSAVGTYQETYHVIPAGMTNVDIKDSNANEYLLPGGFLNIQLLIEKEFLEEVFDVKWARSYDVSPETWPLLVKEYVTQHLYGSDLNKYKTQIYLTGIVFDLLNYRPEVCTLVLIKDESWWNDHRPHTVKGMELPWKLSYEWGTSNAIRISDQNEVLDAMPLNQSVMSGVGAFYLGIEKARSLLRDFKVKCI